MIKKKLTINLGKSYNIYIGDKFLSSEIIKDYCNKLNKRIVIITDSNLLESHGKTLQENLLKLELPSELLSFPAGEINKTRETKQNLEDKLLEKQYGRDTCLIALGGGVVTDLVGFIAATYCRGIPVIYIPTTLLCMVDASIGGKTGVNTKQGKNLIGAFSQPEAVIIDCEALKTLPKNELNNGIVENIKHALIADRNLFNLLYQNQINNNPKFLIDIIHQSLVIKKNIVEQDEHEKNLRQLLNFGHTIGHAIEHIENYKISHGEAVAIGIIVESYLSVTQGYLNNKYLKDILQIFINYDLKLKTRAFNDIKLFIDALMLDKKAVNNIPRFVLIDDIGKPHYSNNNYSTPINKNNLLDAIYWAKNNFSEDK